jgi:heat shock protein HslJ
MKPLAFTAFAALLSLTLSACGSTAQTALTVPSSWAVTEIAGKPAIAGSTVTLDFSADGKVSGNATCNRFTGPVTLTGPTITFGALASTRMACVGEGLNEQETAYLAALAAVDHATITGDALELTGPDAATVRLKRLAP